LERIPVDANLLMMILKFYASSMRETMDEVSKAKCNNRGDSVLDMSSGSSGIASSLR